MHDHLTLDAISNPPSHSRPSDASERSGGCKSILRQGKNWRLPWCSAFFTVPGKL